MAKETNRQKLVKLMYLVFLSLMALNVDVSVLNSFVRVDDGLNETNVNFARKVDMVYSDFDQQKAISEDLVYPYYDRAYYVKELSDSLVNKIKRLRSQTIAEADGIDFEKADTLNLMDLQNKDNYSRTTRFWMTEGLSTGASDGGSGSRAYKLRNTIENYKEEIINQLDSAHREFLRLGLDTEGPFYTAGGDEINWQQAMFNRIPPVAKATSLSRLITDVRNAEFDVISILYGAITEEDFRFDRIEARVVPQSQIVMAGDEYTADIFVAAYDTRQEPTIIVDGREIPVEDGMGKFRRTAGSEGEQSFSGVIRVTSPAGIVQEYEFSEQYTVQRPSVTVSADRMNVFYAGVDNPVSISAPGVPDDNIRASISRGSITREGGGRYTVNVPADVNEVDVSISAIVSGETHPLPSQTFRVQTIPDPTPTIAGQKGGARIPESRLVSNRFVRAEVDESFLFDMDFEIESFTMVTTSRAGDIIRESTTGGMLSDRMIEIIERLRRGTYIHFEDITTRPAADGRRRNLGTVTIRLD